ncbi:MAG TPA: hypothetical protein P5123_05825, partial [Spirochaetota bacterium]|nr:hypothetical protein [Spirochaetota bacterium]
MISFPGYDDIIKRVYEEKQEHVFRFWDAIDDNKKKSLLEDLKNVNFEEINRQYLNASAESVIDEDYGPADYIRLPRNQEESAKFTQARETGVEAIKKGRVCAFIVAGGQGSRLGY